MLPKKYDELYRMVKGLPKRLAWLEKNLNTLLVKSYGDSVLEFDPVVRLREREFKRFSQHGEDGILLYLFSKIGTTDRQFVEFGIQDGKECNTANLSISFGWSGLLMDCSEAGVAQAKAYYAEQLGERASAVQIKPAFVTVENINELISEANISGEIDFLSIDIDGTDYWIWKAIDVINPRLVMMEYNATFGPDLSVTVPYEPLFNAKEKHESRYYHGASLVALTQLAREKGYDLVGCDSQGVNAFYVRSDIPHEGLPTVSVKDAYYEHARRARKGVSRQEQFETIQDLPLEAV